MKETQLRDMIASNKEKLERLERLEREVREFSNRKPDLDKEYY